MCRAFALMAILSRKMVRRLMKLRWFTCRATCRKRVETPRDKTPGLARSLGVVYLEISWLRQMAGLWGRLDDIYKRRFVIWSRWLRDECMGLFAEAAPGCQHSFSVPCENTIDYPAQGLSRQSFRIEMPTLFEP